MSRWISFLAGLMLAASPSLAGERLHVERDGVAGARPLVLVPGLMSAGSLWDETAARYRNSFELHIVTLAGFAGQPPAAIGDGAIEPAAHALAGYLGENALEDAILVGHSIGGQIVLLAAREAGARIGHIVAVDSLPFLAGLYRPGIAPEQAAAQAAMMARQLIALPEDAFLDTLRAGYPVLAKTAAFHETLAEWAATSDRATAVAAMSEGMGSDWRGMVGDISVPLTVILAHDPAMPLAEDALLGLYREQYAAHPGTEFRVVRDSFHFIMIDRPAAFHAELDRIAEIDR